MTRPYAIPATMRTAFPRIAATNKNLPTAGHYHQFAKLHGRLIGIDSPHACHALNRFARRSPTRGRTTSRLGVESTLVMARMPAIDSPRRDLDSETRLLTLGLYWHSSVSSARLRANDFIVFVAANHRGAIVASRENDT